MWEDIMNRLFAAGVLLCTLLSVLIPWTFGRIIRQFHQVADPPWKKEKGRF